MLSKGLLMLAASTVAVTVAQAKPARKPSAVDRPPQFVLLAFDGSKNLDFWAESLGEADTVKTMGNRKARYTYFINPTYYTASENKSAYTMPNLGRTMSCIGWASDNAGEGVKVIPPRINFTNKAFEAGHEIGSHANSHCDAQGGTIKNSRGEITAQWTRWNADEWDSEFSQFNNLLFNSFKINRVQPMAPGKLGNGFSFSAKDIVGFRAPQLGHTEGLWPTLKKYGFRYDTSKSDAPDYWPQRMAWGGWNIPLAQIKVAGTNRKTFSMDYNWFFFHTAGKEPKNLTSADVERMKTQVVDSYLYYFKKNYFGNRAPVQIGHHFSKWNGGAYWEAMKQFSKQVCNRPEVKCVTMTEYTNWLDSQNKNTLDAYRRGDFDRLPDDRTIRDIATPLLAEVRLETSQDGLEALVADSDRSKATQLNWKVQLKINFESQPSPKMSREALLQKFPAGSTLLARAALVNMSGVEQSWQTYRIENFGTDLETVSDPLENKALQPEDANAHNELN